MDGAAPTSQGGRLRAWLELMRISNLPTVWCNVLVGCALGAYAKRFADRTLYEGGVDPAGQVDLLTPRLPFDYAGTAALVALAVSFFYIAGMALNDAADVRVDRAERPGRPIPSGRIPPSHAVMFVIACFVIGGALTALVSMRSLAVAGALAGAIVVYDLSHKRIGAAVVLMGLCRGLVYILAAAATGGQAIMSGYPLRAILALAVAITIYTTIITIIARAEVKDRLDSRRWLAVAMPVIVLLAPLLGVKPGALNPWAGAAGLAVLVWLALPIGAVMQRPPRTIRAILMWLSGMCLVDAYFLAFLHQNVPALLAAACFALTVWGHRRILGT